MPGINQSDATIMNCTSKDGWEAYLQETNTGFWVLKIIIAMVTVIGNGLVIFLIVTRKKLHTTDNWFILSLGLSDLLIGIYITPSELICKFFLACIKQPDVRSFVPNFLIISSICNLCALTVDRYVAILHPLRYVVLMTSRRVKQLVFLAWFLPLIIAGASLILDMSQYKNTVGSYLIVFNIVLVSLIPSLALTIVYLRIYIVVLNQRKMTKSQLTINMSGQPEDNERKSRKRLERSRDRSSIRVLGIVITFFVLCWQPSTYRAICEHFKVCHVTLAVVQTSRILILLNSCVNFTVYALLKRDIRKEFLAKWKTTIQYYRERNSSISTRSVSSTLSTFSTSLRYLDQKIELAALNNNVQ
ncbi:5-hydroxytryptamine receptor 1-like [Actinia tenebrosa]|uniref:5-hydroxytryptamine receptor 1-like n=1 Tax=Actinia tenebrosa TaxID=6105 RepID=A0A6P8ID03_ACTTE|nr:5-hydroxytryptamine receptor 1-like [Actinia tenebrosa]